MAQIKSFDHSSFTVADIDRAVSFWTDVMGFVLDDPSPRTQPWLGGVVGALGATCRVTHLSVHGCHPELIGYDAPHQGESVFGPTVRPEASDLAFFVDDIEGFCDAMVAGGGTMLGSITRCGADGHSGGARAVYMKDSEGIIVQLVEDAS